jgi:IS605 OrfB family transposase
LLSTFEARFDVSPEVSELLAQNACHWSWGLQKAWSLRYRQGFSKSSAYAELCKLGFTSKQVGSLLIAVDMRFAAIKELKKYEFKNLKIAIDKRESAISSKTRKIVSLTKRLGKLRLKRDKLAPQSGTPKSKTYVTVLSDIREADADLKFCINWVKQKTQALDAKRGKLASLDQTIESGRFNLCFGSSKLLAQRPGEHNAETTPFESLDDWQQAWSDARQSQWWSVGHTDQPCGNPEVQWIAEKNQLRIRLTDKVAHARMDALGIPHSGGNSKDMPARMACRFIVIDGVSFDSHNGKSGEWIQKAFGKQPVSMRLLYRRDSVGKVVWYVQASLDVDTGYKEETASNNLGGVLGVDLNAAGVAWSVAKPDGNRLVVDSKAMRGFIPWNLKGLTDLERKQIIGTAAKQFAEIAQELGVGIALENLDFTTKKLTMRAGQVSKRYNEMLSSMATSQFQSMVQRAAERVGVTIYMVNPAFSSVGGYTKYGRLNRCNADEAAAHWLGRQALFGVVWKTEGNTKFVKKQNERLVFAHLSATRTQSTKALADVQWKNVARALGKNRIVWGENFKNWFQLRVESASLSDTDRPSEEISMETKNGYQPGTSRPLGGASTDVLFGKRVDRLHKKPESGFVH